MGARGGSAVTEDVTPPEENDEPAEMMVVDDLNQLRILANHLRVAIIEEVTSAPRTVAEVGHALGISPAKLYYHFRELELAGLIRLVPAAEGNPTKQRYRATARFYHLSSKLLHPNGSPGLLDASAEFVVAALDHTTSDLRRAFNVGAIAATPEVLGVQRRTARMSRAEARQFRDRLRELAADFHAADRPDGEIAVELGFALFPRPGTAPLAGHRRQRTGRARRFPQRRRNSRLDG